MICLDTNAVISAINRHPLHVRSRLEVALQDGIIVAIPAIVLYEIWYGLKKSARREMNEAILATFLALGLISLAFDADDAKEAGDIRAALERAGTRIGPYDILIAAQARRRNAMIVSANTREFARVPGLRCVDWTTV